MDDDISRVVYEFGPFCADPVKRRLSANGVALPITPKAFETLMTLLGQPGNVVSKGELMDAVWADTAVEENNLTQQIATLRRALGDNDAEKRYIVTVPGRGYAFVAPIRHVDITPASDLAPSPGGPRVFAIDRWRWRDGSLGTLLAIAYVLVVFFCVLISKPQSNGQVIAVMTFRTSDLQSQDLGYGIRDTLRARLGSLDDVVVRPSSPAVGDQDAIRAGHDLHADVVLSGSVQRENDKVRVAIEIIDVGASRLVWGETFDQARPVDFELQDAIAAKVVDALNSRRTGKAVQKL